MRRAAVGANVGEQRVVNCAPTGIAATNLPGGNTLHCTFAINAMSNRLTASGPSLELAKARLVGTRVVVVDEASMVDAVRMIHIDRRLRDWFDSELVRVHMHVVCVCAVSLFDARSRLAALASY